MRTTSETQGWRLLRVLLLWLRTLPADAIRHLLRLERANWSSPAIDAAKANKKGPLARAFYVTSRRA